MEEDPLYTHANYSDPSALLDKKYTDRGSHRVTITVLENPMMAERIAVAIGLLFDGITAIQRTCFHNGCARKESQDKCVV